jgi:hypothetical protein
VKPRRRLNIPLERAREPPDRSSPVIAPLTAIAQAGYAPAGRVVKRNLFALAARRRGEAPIVG